VDSKEHLSPELEKKRYEFHQNSPSDMAYQNFLNQLIEPLLKFINIESVGLDYGCGPGPTISQIMKGQGIKVSDYDPFFFDNTDLLKSKYDFITSTEVFEHFREPKKEIEKLLSMLKPEGVLAIMTSTYDKVSSLSNWYYLKDPTHISFYHHETMKWIEANCDLDLIFYSKNIFIFKAL
jgi:2-polyprenyl-3-methyl-5-hydroxy-6-metoxy-1,4-benzoquinol methylase